MLVLASIPGADRTMWDSDVYVVFHVRQIVFLSQRIVHASLPRVSDYRRIMCES